jgi:hypothetical protein
MTNETKIREAWARYHGPPLPGDDEIPQAPPAYSRGYRDGYAACKSESNAQTFVGALAIVDGLQDQIDLLKITLQTVKDADIAAHMEQGSFALPESVRRVIDAALESRLEMNDG